MKANQSNYMPTPEQYLAALPEEPGSGRPVKPPKSSGRKVHRTIVGILVVLILSSLAYVVYIALNVAKISTKPFDVASLARDQSGRTNILILGVGDPGHAGEKLSDSIMVVSIDHQSKRVAQISLPRDLRVQIPDHGFGKINSAHALGGVQLASQTVSNTLNIPVHHYVKTDFSGLVGLVDAVGGLEIDVKERLVDPEYPCADNQYKVCGLVIESGKQQMDGARVLQYARCRKGTCGNDFGRAERQQEVMNLLKDRIVQLEVLANPTKLAPITAAVRGGIETDMGVVQMLEFAKLWQEAGTNQPLRLVLSTDDDGMLRGAAGSSDLVPVTGNFNQIQDRVWRIFELNRSNIESR